MKRRYAHERRIRIRQGYLGWLERFIKELRGLLDDRDSKIRVLEGRIRKVEHQNVELAKAVIETSVAVKNRQYSKRGTDGRELVFKTEQFAVTFDFNSASFPRILVGEIPLLNMVAHLIEEVLVEKVNALDCPDVGKRNLANFVRDYCCCPFDGLDKHLPELSHRECEAARRATGRDPWRPL